MEKIYLVRYTDENDGTSGVICASKENHNDISSEVIELVINWLKCQDCFDEEIEGVVTELAGFGEAEWSSMGRRIYFEEVNLCSKAFFTYENATDSEIKQMQTSFYLTTIYASREELEKYLGEAKKIDGKTNHQFFSWRVFIDHNGKTFYLDIYDYKERYEDACNGTIHWHIGHTKEHKKDADAFVKYLKWQLSVDRTKKQ